MINYTWKILIFNCTKDKIVKSINWNYIGIKNDISFIVNGETYVPEPDFSNFTDFENLTFEQVCNWIENLVDVTAMQTNISEQIELLEQPKTITLNPPF